MLDPNGARRLRLKPGVSRTGAYWEGSVNTIATWRRVMDFVFYILIGLVCAAATLFWAAHHARTGGSVRLPLKWLGFGAMTAIAFGYTISSHRPNWRKTKFWSAVTVLATVQLAAGYLVISRIDHLPLIYLAPLGAADYVVLAMCLEYVTPVHSKNS